jgi:hypothetical protein
MSRPMPRPSNLRLTHEQETALDTYISQRLDALDASNASRILADRRSRDRYKNQRKDREIKDTVYEHSNVPLPLTSLVVDYFLGRTHDEILGEKPFFSARPQGASDREDARAIERFARYKLCDQAGLEDSIDDALTSLHVQQALFLKAVHKEEVDEFERYGLKALHDTSVNPPKPVQIAGVGFILEDATWVEQVDPASMIAPAPGAPAPAQPATRMHLEADPSFIFDPVKHAMMPLPPDTPVPFRRVLYSGPKSEEIKSENIRAPMDARSFEEADFIAEYSDRTADWLLDRFLERSWFKADDYRSQLSSQNANAKTPGMQPEASSRVDIQEDKVENKAFDTRTRRVPVAECWITWDVLERGRPQRIVVWWDRERKKSVYYEYQANVSANGRHPYRAVSLGRDECTWWGLSIPELVEQFQEYVDLQFNRHSFRNSINANPIIGTNPDAIQEKVPLSQIRPGMTVTLENNRTIQDFLQAFVFPNADLDTEMLLDKCVYFVQLWFGISNLAQGDYGDVPQNTTAFGQDATLREAAKYSRRITKRAQSGIKLHILDLVQVMVATMDEQEKFFFTEGGQSLSGTITADRVRALTIDVSMVVGRAQNAQAIQATNLAIQIVEKYAMMLVQSPWMAEIVRPLYTTSLRLLGFDDVEQLLPDPRNPGAALVAAQQAMLLKGAVPESGKDSPQAPAEDPDVVPFSPESGPQNAGASIVNPPPAAPSQNQGAANG